MKSIESYTAASAFPLKIMHNNIIKNGNIKPYHIQLIPTNACNLNCEFCSCSDRDKKKKIPFEKIKNILNICQKFGTKAVTITGGGEPMLYKNINELIDYTREKKMEVGLVSNGKNIDKLNYHNNLTWCRISSSDDRTPEYKNIKFATQLNFKTDWAFSHVLTKNPNLEVIVDLIKFANKNKFSHVRLVSDLLDLENVPDMHKIKQEISNFVDDSLVIYQGRKDSTCGDKDCYISLLKPVIAPEGIFPCCGVMYSNEDERRDLIDKMKMGELKDLESFFKNQNQFNGTVCSRCYYNQYNKSLKQIKEVPEHKKFI